MNKLNSEKIQNIFFMNKSCFSKQHYEGNTVVMEIFHLLTKFDKTWSLHNVYQLTKVFVSAPGTGTRNKINLNCRGYRAVLNDTASNGLDSLGTQAPCDWNVTKEINNVAEVRNLIQI